MVLLAIPHYLIVGVFAGGWGLGWEDGRWAAGLGLIGLLSVVSMVMVAFRRTYPSSLYEFIMGMNRWCYRVLADAALMRDEYPPFRLDQGGADPGTPTEPPAAGDRRAPLAA